MSHKKFLPFDERLFPMDPPKTDEFENDSSLVRQEEGELLTPCEQFDELLPSEEVENHCSNYYPAEDPTSLITDPDHNRRMIAAFHMLKDDNE